jgi:hypothetical protein
LSFRRNAAKKAGRSGASTPSPALTKPDQRRIEVADDPIEQTKACTKCGEIKRREQFWTDKRKKSGLTAACIPCAQESNRKWRKRHPGYAAEYRARRPDVVRAASARWRERHPDRAREIEAKRAPRDPAKRREYNQAYFEANKEVLCRASQKRYAENREQALKTAAAWRAANADKKQAWRLANKDREREYDTKRRSTPRGRIDDAVSAGIRDSLRKGAKAGRKWEVLVGYTVDDLMAHLERQFIDGMSWNNYGDWHIDHVIPKAAFNYTSPEHADFIRCWGLNNLQPLWAVDNMKKSDSLPGPFQPSLAL